MAEWTEGICDDGAAILRDGEMVPISEVLHVLNTFEQALWVALASLEIGLVADQAAKYPRTVEIVNRPDGSVLVRRARQ